MSDHDESTGNTENSTCPQPPTPTAIMHEGWPLQPGQEVAMGPLPEEWCPMSSAPRDGTWVEGQWQNAEGATIRYSANLKLWISGDGIRCSEPTHWRPIPAKSVEVGTATPETDAAIEAADIKARNVGQAVARSEYLANFARKLERERDEARAELRQHDHIKAVEALIHEGRDTLTKERDDLAGQVAEANEQLNDKGLKLSIVVRQRDDLSAQLQEMKSKRAENVSPEEALELMDVLRTICTSGRAFVTSARELVAAYERMTAERDDFRTQLARATARIGEVERELATRLPPADAPPQ